MAGKKIAYPACCEDTAMNRRNFLHWCMRYGMTAVVPMTIQGLPVSAFARSPYFNTFAQAAYSTGRVLVLIQLFGGNDGLNTVVPFEDDTYYRKRPTLALPRNSVLPINSTLGFHSNMSDMRNLFNDGKMCVVQGVGYENPNRSHFRSTDIWMSGFEADVVEQTGWIGRHLQMSFPDFPEALTPDPLAVQIGSSLSLVLESEKGGMGIALQDPEEFYELVNAGQSSPEDVESPLTPAGYELEFVRTIQREAKQYASRVREAALQADNLVEYPTQNISQQLQIVARLIAGGLETGVYLVGFSGFDTHADQTGRHGNLIRYLSEAVGAFQQDLESLGIADRVITMTFSEFGRRLKENGSSGTDHGTAAPMFLIGQGVGGGVIGGNPDLQRLDRTGDIFHTYDFRQVYASVLSQWLGLSGAHIEGIFQEGITQIPLIASPITSVVSPPGTQPESYRLLGNYPNPFNPGTKICFRSAGGHIRIVIYDMLGREVSQLVNKRMTPGLHEIPFDASRLASGTYYYRMTTPDYSETKKMILLK